MGYTTDFTGSLTLNKELTSEQKSYINTFSNNRRMKRNVNKLMELYHGKFGFPGVPENSDPKLIYGRDGEYFVKYDDNFGQIEDDSIIDYNTPPGQISYRGNSNFHEIYIKNEEKIKNGECQPGLWCQWIINENNELEWDGGEKFYNYVEWLQYLINHFFSKWNVLLNGEIEWVGEDRDDLGKIIVKDNIIKIEHGHITYS